MQHTRITQLGHAPFVLNQKNRSAARLPQLGHSIPETAHKLFVLHIGYIRNAIYDVESSRHLGNQIYDFRVHLPVSRKAQIDQRILQTA